MRVPASKALRVGPGDEVHVVARLPQDAELGRLFVFAKESRGNSFSPYAPSNDIVVDGRPTMVMPFSLRLTRLHPTKELRFTVDFDGYVRIMQEVDTANDQIAKLRLTRTVCPRLGWREWFLRRLPWRPLNA